MKPAALAIGGVHGGRVLPWRTFSLAGLALALYLVAGPAPEALVYDRVAIAAGEWWRLITGHWVHSDADHALWDIAALILFGALFEVRVDRDVLWNLASGTLAIDLWLWWALPDLIRYCGLSGILNALIAAGLGRAWRATRDLLLAWLGAALCAKIGVELFSGSALFTHTAWPSVPGVHAIGFAVGLSWFGFRGLASQVGRATSFCCPTQ